jgi:hypothetical protein
MERISDRLTSTRVAARRAAMAFKSSHEKELTAERVDE